MTDILPNGALSRLFSSRIRHYLLFLQVTNNLELICLLTDYLQIPDILNFLSTSTHLRSFTKIPAIQIRLLKAKVEFYEKPKIQPTYQTYMNFLHLKVPTTQHHLKSQKLARDHECLKKLNKELRLSKQLKKNSNRQGKSQFQNTEHTNLKEFSNNGQQYGPKHELPSPNAANHPLNQNKQINEKVDKIIKNVLFANHQKDNTLQINSYQKRLQQVQYQVARQDLQKRKTKRLQQQKDLEYFITIEQLKKMAEQDPCSRQTLQKIQAEELQRIQRANVQKLRMKPIKIDQKDIEKLKMMQEAQKQKMVVVKQSLAQKLFSNIKVLIRKQ